MRAGVATAMTAYNTPADIPIVISQKWTGRWLRGEAAFQGLVVTDWTEIYNQIDWHRTASTPLEAISQALTRASLDLVRVCQPCMPPELHDRLRSDPRTHQSSATAWLWCLRVLASIISLCTWP